MQRRRTFSEAGHGKKGNFGGANHHLSPTTVATITSVLVRAIDPESARKLNNEPDTAT